MRVEEVLIGIPTRGSVSAATVSQLDAERALNAALPPIAYSAGHLSVFEMRNDLVGFFLQGPWECLIMVDDDVVPPRNVVELVSWTDVMGDFDIIGCAYPVFQPGLAPLPVIAAYEWDEETKGHKPFGDCWQRRGAQEVDAVGFGCVAINRRAFDKLSFPWFQEQWTSEHGWASDDIAFCAVAREAGLKIGCNFDMQAEHLKQISLLTLMEGVGALFNDLANGTDEAVDLIRERNAVPA